MRQDVIMTVLDDEDESIVAVFASSDAVRIADCLIVVLLSQRSVSSNIRAYKPPRILTGFSHNESQ
jgi:hypothetical protein